MATQKQWSLPGRLKTSTTVSLRFPSKKPRYPWIHAFPSYNISHISSFFFSFLSFLLQEIDLLNPERKIRMEGDLRSKWGRKLRGYLIDNCLIIVVVGDKISLYCEVNVFFLILFLFFVLFVGLSNKFVDY